MFDSLVRHRRELAVGGWPVFLRKSKSALRAATALPLVLLGAAATLPLVLIMRLMRPWLLIRLKALNSDAIGQFALETELYLCERDAGVDVPRRRYVDLCYFDLEPICNDQLARMWARQVTVWPAWLLRHVERCNRWVPGGDAHRCMTSVPEDRDIHDLLHASAPHLAFTAEEEKRGKARLEAMGLPADAEFICLHSRDPAYMNAVFPADNAGEESHRDSDIQDCVPAAEALAELGYFVIRMGSVVSRPMLSNHPRVIDYAMSARRDDFMDIYLGARCLFCLGCSSGYVAIPIIFRRPVGLVNFSPLGWFFTFLSDCVGIVKRYRLIAENRLLSLREISEHGVDLCETSSGYNSRGVQWVDNTPEEIKAVALEMLQRLKGTWQSALGDDALQKRFWEVYPRGLRDEYQRPLLGRVRARCGAQYLRDCPEFLA